VILYYQIVRLTGHLFILICKGDILPMRRGAPYRNFYPHMQG